MSGRHGGSAISLFWGRWKLDKRCIHKRHIQSVVANQYAVHQHMIAALHIFTHTTVLAQILGFWVTVLST
jgi:hypothetical protein